MAGASGEFKATLIPAPQASYRPVIRQAVDHGRLVADMAEFLGLGRDSVEATFRTYRRFHEAKGYAHRFGELKTLCFEEAFVIHTLLAALRPKRLVEIGTAQGRSTRRILDSIALAGLECRVTTFDIANQATHFTPDEATLAVEDLRGRFRPRVLQEIGADVIFIDMHDYALLDEAVGECLADEGRRVLAIHDCTAGLCNPRMTLAKDDPNVTSETGTWERHILAARFGVADPLSPALDRAATATHRLTIFDTPHGLGVLMRKG
jgi:hypothetical protein